GDDVELRPRSVGRVVGEERVMRAATEMPTLMEPDGPQRRADVVETGRRRQQVVVAFVTVSEPAPADAGGVERPARAFEDVGAGVGSVDGRGGRGRWRGLRGGV